MKLNFNLNDPIHCYLLGYFWADCYFGKPPASKGYGFSFEIKEEDFLNIWDLLKTLGFWKYRTRSRKNSTTKQCTISLCKQESMEFFKAYNFHKKLDGCKLYFDLSENMKMFFIKGFLDGDGSISLHKDGSFRVSFNGDINQNWDFLEDYFQVYGLKYAIYKKERISGNGKTHRCSVVEVLKNENKKKFCESLINSDIGLRRKMNVFYKWADLPRKMHSFYFG
jgi:hypothetical protein